MPTACAVCGRSVEQHGLTMYRTNPLGEVGVWACAQHRGLTPVDPIVEEIVTIIEEDNAALAARVWTRQAPSSRWQVVPPTEEEAP
jgi:hypothetical protein